MFPFGEGQNSQLSLFCSVFGSCKERRYDATLYNGYMLESILLLVYFYLKETYCIMQISMFLFTCRDLL